MTKIEELVEAIEEYVDEDKFVSVPRVVLGSVVVFRAVEALEELREAAIALDGFRVWCAELNDSPPLHELLRVDEDRGAE